MPNQPSHDRNIRHQVANQPLGSMLTTSSGFITEMNKISNRFAGELSEQLLGNLQNELSD
jgi:hypothetical protein